MQAHRASRAHRARIGIAFILVGTILGVGGLMPSPAQAVEGDKVSICHRTNSVTNPYRFITVAATSVDGQGNNDHTSHLGPIFDFDNPGQYSPPHNEWGDIIPGGLNWTTDGQAIHANSCNDPVTEPCTENCEPPCDADGTTETTEDDCPEQTCEEAGNCPEIPCEQTELGCRTNPCPPPDESIGDKCYPPCAPPTTRVGDECVPPADEPEPETETCPAPGTLVNGVCTQPQAQVQTTPPAVLGVVLTRAPAAPELPRTGKDTAALVALGMVLTVAGSLLVASAKLVRPPA